MKMGFNSIARAATVAATFGGITIGSLSLVAQTVSPAATTPPVSRIADIEREQADSERELERLDRQLLAWANDRALFLDAAKLAWTFVDKHYQPTSGLTSAVDNWAFVTVWDIGSALAALYAAHELDLINRTTYETRMQKVLGTLLKMRLYDGAIYNKMYDARTGAMVGRNTRPSSRGFGWSATDVGRLLIWLKIIAVQDEQFRPTIEAIVKRLKLNRVVINGYLFGEEVGNRGPHAYQEGRIGYEQYAAQGFALWGHRAERALSLTENALPVWVLGQELIADVRGRDRLTNEPFFLMGLETGWDPPTHGLVTRMLLAQEMRYHNTGIVTLLSEDAIAEPPAYFYYYCLVANGRQFSIDTQLPGMVAEGPRWTSTKAAFAFHALMPNWYTHVVLDKIQSARMANGWASGVYERTNASTGTPNVNTAAVVLTAALYDLRGEPLIRTLSKSTN